MPLNASVALTHASSDPSLQLETSAEPIKQRKSRDCDNLASERIKRIKSTKTSPQRALKESAELRQACVNGLAPERLKLLFEISQDILAANSVTRTIKGEQYTGTMPSKDFYVHQWFWDSATHALALTKVDPLKALDELASLCVGQWDNGFIAQIQFFPEAGEKIYFPGAEFWGTDDCAPEGVRTSGITQPPIFSLAAPAVLASVLKKIPQEPQERNPQQVKLFQRIEKVLESAYRYNQFLKQQRDAENSGLITVVHPWESGLDNAVQWDKPLQSQAFAIEAIPDHVIELVDRNRKDVVKKTADKSNQTNAGERPEQKKYYDYIKLVDQFSGLNWHQKAMAEQSDFRVKDVLFTSIFSTGCEDLSRFYQSDIAKAYQLSDDERADKLSQWAQISKQALENTWDEQMERYLCQDLNQAQSLKTDTISGFSPLLAGVFRNTSRLQILLNALNDPEKYNTTFSVPTAALDNPQFDSKRYWRGCVWPITNFLMIKSLDRVANEFAQSHPKLADQATSIKQRLLNHLNLLVDQVGFQEYYQPNTQEQTKIGFGNFSWTAAIFILNNAKAYHQLQS